MIVCWFDLEVGCLGVLLSGLFDLIILVCLGESCGVVLRLVFIAITFWVSLGLRFAARFSVALTDCVWLLVVCVGLSRSCFSIVAYSCWFWVCGVCLLVWCIGWLFLLTVVVCSDAVVFCVLG